MVYLLCVFLYFTTQICAQTAERRNIAVVTFDARGVSPIEAEAVADRIRNEFTKADVYQVVERGLMEEIMEEQAFQLTGACTESECLVEVGKILAVHFMAGGSVTKVGNLFTIDARIIDVESGKIVQNVIEDYLGPIENLMVHTTKIVANKLMGLEEEFEAVMLGGTSDLLVKSNPFGATIYINDSPVGDITPYTIQGLMEGEYRVKAKKGNLVGEKLVLLKKNEIKEIVINLELEKFLIRLYSTPTGAEAYIDNKKIGQTPVDYTVTDTTLDYIVELRKDLYKTVVDTVHFQKNPMLRMNVSLAPCGRIFIPVNLSGVNVYLDGMPVESYPYYDGVKGMVDQMDFGDYIVRMEKQYHHPFEATVSLTESLPAKTIIPRFDKLESVLTLLNGSSDVEGQIIGAGAIIRSFSIAANDKSPVTVPYGDYQITARAKGFLPFRENVKVFSQELQTIHLRLKRPDQKKAIIRSLLFPGVGQIYSLQHYKGGILAVVLTAGMSWAYSSWNNYSPELDRYDEYNKNYMNATTINDMNKYRVLANDSRDKLNSYRIQLLSAMGVSVVTYVLNLVDITWLYPYKQSSNSLSLYYNGMESGDLVSIHYFWEF